MRKLATVLLAVSVWVLGTSVSFAQKPNEVSRNIQKSLNQELSRRSAGAHDKAVFDMKLQVSTVWQKPINSSEAVQTHNKPCSAVRIDKNWMLASLTCRGIGNSATAYDHNGDPYTKEIASRTINKASIRAKYMNSRDDIWPRDIFFDEGAEIILLRLDETNKDLQKELADGDGIVANLLIANNPGAVAKTMENAFINRERQCQPGRCSDAVDIDYYCVAEKCYKVGWELIDGDAGDPLFIVSKSDTKKGLGSAEFLLGFNNAIIDGGSTQSGRLYRAFDQKTLNAIKRIIQPVDAAAWQRISSHVRSEKEI